MSKPRKIKPHGPLYYTRAYTLLHNPCPCCKCGSPVVSGYICSWCGHDPSYDYDPQPKEFPDA